MINKLINIILVLFLLIGCDPVQNLKIYNDTNERIYLVISDDSKFDFPPISFDKNGDTLWKRITYVNSKEKLNLPVIGNRGWENFILRNSKDSTLNVFFFNNNLLKLYSSDSIVKYQKYSSISRYKLKQLKKKKWEIEYADLQSVPTH